MKRTSFGSLAIASVAFCASPVVAFQVRTSTSPSGTALTDRRSLIENLAKASVASVFLASPNVVQASGGATAGGAYLLSAKQRYNDRVKAGSKGFLALASAIESGDLDAVRPYFSKDDNGSWNDFSTAGYLLANAFRRNSTAAPDSLPSVKVSLI